MNYLYKIKGEEIILSENEHMAIKQAQEQGLDMVYLRGESLGINPKRVDFFRETTELTAPQEVERRASLKLTSGEYTKDFSDQRTEGLKKLGNWVRKQGWHKITEK